MVVVQGRRPLVCGSLLSITKDGCAVGVLLASQSQGQYKKTVSLDTPSITALLVPSQPH